MFLLIILWIAVAPLLGGCSIPYVSNQIVKKDEIVNIYRTRAPETIRELEEKDPRWFFCFDKIQEEKSKLLASDLQTCIQDNAEQLNWYFHLGEMNEVLNETKWPFLITLEELTNYKVFSYHCALSKYIEQNIADIDIETLSTDFRCRSILFWYVLSNDINPKNELIFKKFAQSIIYLYEVEKPDIFYCFDKRKEDLVDDMNTAIGEAIFSLHTSRFPNWQRLPYGRHSEDKYNTFVKILLKLYFGTNMTGFSLKNLNDEQERECSRVLLPQIKSFYPHFLSQEELTR